MSDRHCPNERGKGGRELSPVGRESRERIIAMAASTPEDLRRALNRERKRKQRDNLTQAQHAKRNAEDLARKRAVCAAQEQSQLQGAGLQEVCWWRWSTRIVLLAGRVVRPRFALLLWLKLQACCASR